MSESLKIEVRRALSTLQRLGHQAGVGSRLNLVRQHIEQSIVLALRERSIDREMTTRDLDRVGYFRHRHVKLFGQLCGGRFALVLLLKLGELLADLVQRAHAVQRKTDD